MAIEVFNRCEYKYILTDEEFRRIQEFLEKFMVLDKHNVNGELYTISNIYYDTVCDDMIRHSISKPLYKEKLRLRSYGTPNKKDKVYIEIKKKYKGVVNKRRSRILLCDAYEFIDKGSCEIKDYMNGQVIKEIEYMLSGNRLSPKVYIAYDRLAYFGKEDKNLRISFDTNIRTRRHNLRLECDDETRPLLENKYWIMEIKDRYAMPLWLADYLSENGILRRSFSKYGTEYKKRMAEI